MIDILLPNLVGLTASGASYGLMSISITCRGWLLFYLFAYLLYYIFRYDNDSDSFLSRGVSTV